jgi:hypothetical protein
VRQYTSTTPIDTSREEEQKEGRASEATTRTRTDERERREGTGNQDDYKTGELGEQIQEVYIGEQSWSGEQKKCK